MKRFAYPVAIAAIMAGCTTQPAVPERSGPQSAMDELIVQEMQTRRQRLQGERYESEQRNRYRQASNGQIMQEIARFCPGAQQPCSQAPPQVLIDEAARRGLVQYRGDSPGSSKPVTDCVILGDGLGGGTVHCD